MPERLLPGMNAFAVPALFLAVGTFIRKLKLPASFAGLDQPIGINGNGCQTITLQDGVNCIVEAVTYDMQVNIVLLDGFYELGKIRIDRDLFQAIVQFVKAGIQKRDLAAHAFFRADFTGNPVVFQFLMAGHTKTLQQGIRNIAGTDGIVEIAQNEWSCHFATQYANGYR